MKFRQKKLTVAITLIIISLFVNLVQYNILRNYKQEQRSSADNEFRIGLEMIIVGVNRIKKKEIDELSNMALLSAGTSKANTTYALTSYYKSNPLLMDTISQLNENITNRINIREVLDKNDLTVLIPAIQKVIDNPLDETATKELDYLVRKYTAIISPSS